MKILLLAAALFSALSAAPASPGEKTDLQELFRSLDRAITRSRLQELFRSHDRVIARSREDTARRASRSASVST